MRDVERAATIEPPATGGPHRFLYDEDCGICTRLAGFVRRFAREPLDLVPMHTVQVGEGIHGTLGDERYWASAHFIRSDGRAFHDGASVTRVLRLLPGGGAFALLDLPGVRRIRDRVYYVVAHNRHHISSLLGLDRCRIHR